MRSLEQLDYEGLSVSSVNICTFLFSDFEDFKRSIVVLDIKLDYNRKALDAFS